MRFLVSRQGLAPRCASMLQHLRVVSPAVGVLLNEFSVNLHRHTTRIQTPQVRVGSMITLRRPTHTVVQVAPFKQHQQKHITTDASVEIIMRDIIEASCAITTHLARMRTMRPSATGAGHRPHTRSSHRRDAAITAHAEKAMCANRQPNTMHTVALHGASGSQQHHRAPASAGHTWGRYAWPTSSAITVCNLHSHMPCQSTPITSYEQVVQAH